ncbi:hypothetical protein B9Z55_003350 [Caenorhabditis nigoni]|uniref:Uncharacterized protein n=1 Tax=Caenorhabditis nigoni TaxID=1611254 RepID=A0A2G5VQ85_9PELO|nr:hypothetical protein B9Z55_003350 [Caenorhabditis nigoni]
MGFYYDCGCISLALNSATIQNYITPKNPFYPLLSTATLESPILTVEDCYARMLCDGDGYSLVVFDETALGKIFADYAAEGFCDTTDNNWWVNTRDVGLTKFEQLYGICFTSEIETTVASNENRTTTASESTSEALSTVITEQSTESSYKSTVTDSESSQKGSTVTTVASSTVPSETSDKTSTSSTEQTGSSYTSTVTSSESSENITTSSGGNTLSTEATYNTTQTSYTSTMSSEPSESTSSYTPTVTRPATTENVTTTSGSISVTTDASSTGGTSNQYYTVSSYPPTVTRYVCPCVDAALDSSNITDYIDKDSLFYDVLTDNNTRPPQRIPFGDVNSCGVAFVCFEGYQLLIFDDTGLGVMIDGAYMHSPYHYDNTHDGYCRDDTGKWIVYYSNRKYSATFNQMYAICLLNCSCPSENLDNSNIKSFLNPINPFYKTITSLTLKSPVFVKNECEGSMYCEGQEDDLLLFDSTGLGKIFRGEQFHGTCNQSTEAWDVDTGNGPEILTSFKELYGTCISRDTCNCTATPMNHTMIRSFIDQDSPFFDVLTSSESQSPVFTFSGCSGSMACPSGLNLVLFDSTGLGKIFDATSASGTCDSKSQKWKIDTGSKIRLTTFREMFGVCVPNENAENLVTTTPTDLSTPPPNEFNCTTMDNTTFILAYSNDVNQKAFTDAWLSIMNAKTSSGEQNPTYSLFGRYRYDLDEVENLEFFDSWESLNESVFANLPNSSLSTSQGRITNDIFNMLNMVLNITDVSICGAHLFVFGHHFTNSSERTVLHTGLGMNDEYITLVMTFDYDLTVPAYEASDIYRLATYAHASVITFDVNFRIPGMFLEASKPYLHYESSVGVVANTTSYLTFGTKIPSNESYISINFGGIRSFRVVSARLSLTADNIKIIKDYTGNEFYYEEHGIVNRGDWEIRLDYVTSPDTSSYEPDPYNGSHYQFIGFRVFDKTPPAEFYRLHYS